MATPENNPAEEPQLPPNIDLNDEATQEAIISPDFQLALIDKQIALIKLKQRNKLEEKEIDHKYQIEQRRLQNIEKAQNAKRLQANITYLVGGITLVIVLLASAIILLNPKSSDKNQEWARTTFTSVTLGLVAFFFGKQIGSTSSSERENRE